MQNEELLKENGEMEKITKEELPENPGRTPLSDDELDKVAGGQNSDYCICNYFSPQDGNWNNKTYSNC